MFTFSICPCADLCPLLAAGQIVQECHEARIPHSALLTSFENFLHLGHRTTGQSTECIMSEQKDSTLTESRGQGNIPSPGASRAEEITRSETRRIIQKFDLHLLTLFTIINLVSFIDRVNIGNARLLGLQDDLDLSGNRFNIALTCLLVTYCVVELPSNILCKIIGGHIYVPCLVLGFGLITTCTALVTDRGGLYACRVLLGIFEGGISPGLVFMLSLL
jgi:hypothetical protein